MVIDFGDILAVNKDTLSDAVEQKGDVLEEIVEYYLESLVDKLEALIDRPIDTCFCLEVITEDTLDRGYCSTCMRKITLLVDRQPP
jgi:hypothetical protein